MSELIYRIRYAWTLWRGSQGTMSLDGAQSLYALGFTKDGNPKHPMARGRSRIPNGTQPILWRTAL